MDISGHNRIMIVGNNGSGKSFLSKELSALTGLPLIHLDIEFWKPNWEQTPKDEWIKKQADFIAKEKWNFSKTRINTIMELNTKYPDKPFIVIKSRRQLKQMMAKYI